MMKKDDDSTLNLKLAKQQQLNRILVAENNELKKINFGLRENYEIYLEFKKEFDVLMKKYNDNYGYIKLIDKMRGNFMFKGARKIYHFIKRDNHE